jgi:hypothetical protein
MTTLATAPLDALLDRLFSEAEAPPSPEFRAALDQTAPEERDSLPDYLRFYSLAKSAYLAVSRETAELLYMLVRSTGAPRRRVRDLVRDIHAPSRGRTPRQRRRTRHHHRVRAVEDRARA